MRQHAYEPDDLDETLDEQMKRFVNDPQRNTIDRPARKLRLSKLFEEHAADFDGKSALAAYVSKFVEGDSVEGYGVEFRDSDQSLNSPR